MLTPSIHAFLNAIRTSLIYPRGTLAQIKTRDGWAIIVAHSTALGVTPLTFEVFR
jgi:hypothetical protein